MLDDVQDPADLRELWPPHTPPGHVVVTTRRRDARLFRGDHRRIDVGVFTEAESVSYLTDKLPGQADNAEQLRALATDLGHLPLALAQAAAFIVDKPLLTVAAHRERLADRRRTLAQVLPDEGELSDEHQATVAATWSLSIERADSLAPQGLARPLLELISLLDPAGVPTAVFTSGPILSHLTELTKSEVNPDTVDDGLGCLHRLSLITLDTAQPARAVQAHALLQRAVRDTPTPDHLTRLAHITADALLDLWRDNDTDSLLTPALRSATDVLHTTTTPALCNRGVHPVLFRVGRSLGEASLRTAAITHFHRLHRQADHHLGPDNPDTLRTRYNLAFWRRKAGNDAAVAEVEQVLADQLRVLGPDHLDTLTTRNLLASRRAAVGDHVGAVAEYERLLADQLRVLGPDHSDTLTTGNDLASRQQVAGAVAEVEQLLADQLRVLGPDHLDTLTTRNNLAFKRAIAGDHVGAVAEYERLLANQLRVLGPDHRNTLRTRFRLAHYRAEAGDHSGVGVELEQVLADQLRVLGPNHPDTFLTHSNLSHWRRKDGGKADLVALLKRQLADQLRELGPEHPDTLSTRNSLTDWQAVTKFQHRRRASRKGD